MGLGVLSSWPLAPFTGGKMIEVSIHYPIGRLVGEPASDKVRLEFTLPKRPFLLWIDDRLAESIPYPKGYGVAFKEWFTGRLLLAPMPFNILIGGLIWGYHWLRIGFASWCWKHRPGMVRRG
jgi:hypothetical protein